MSAHPDPHQGLKILLLEKYLRCLHVDWFSMSQMPSANAGSTPQYFLAVRECIILGWCARFECLEDLLLLGIIATKMIITTTKIASTEMIHNCFHRYSFEHWCRPSMTHERQDSPQIFCLSRFWSRWLAFLATVTVLVQAFLASLLASSMF